MIDNVGEIVFSGDLLVALPIAFLAGLLAFLSPCIIPLVPGYIAYVSGFAISAEPTPADRRRVLLGVLGFVTGMGAVFISLSVMFGTLGLLLVPYLDVVLRVSGVVLILLGVVFAGGIPALQRDILPQWKTRAGVWGSPFLGIVFAIGWVPCVGPTLAAVQTLALSSHEPARAAVLGIAYWLGLALPFVVVALLLGRILPALAWVRRHIKAINRAGGTLLVIIGVLMVLGIWRELLSWAGVFQPHFNPSISPTRRATSIRPTHRVRTDSTPRFAGPNSGHWNSSDGCGAYSPRCALRSSCSYWWRSRQFRVRSSRSVRLTRTA